MVEGDSARGAVVIGVGNPFRGDDGVGPAVLEALRAGPGVPAGTRLVDSDGEPMRTVLAWEGAGLAIVVDGVRTGAAPGTVHRLDPDRLAASSGPAGTHSAGPGDAVALGRATGRMPDRLVVLGVEVGDVGLGDRMSEPVVAAVTLVADLVMAELIGETHQTSTGGG